MSNTGVTVARLRKVLVPHFDREPVETILRRLREAGVIDAGKPGRNGTRSATLDTRQAVLVLLALSVAGGPAAAPTEARRIADFRLRRIENEHILRHLSSLSDVTLLDQIVAEIESARGSLGFQPDTWAIGQDDACQIKPENRLVFTATEQPVDRNDYTVRHETRLRGRIIADIAELFGPAEPQLISPAIDERVRSALGLASQTGPTDD